MQTETQTEVEGATLSQWPPVAHIARGTDPQEGDKALCGARLMGIKLDEAAVQCEECVRIFRGEVGGP